MAYQVDIHGVLGSLGAQRDVSGELDLGEVTLGEETFSFAEPATFDVALTNTGAGIVASGEVRARARATCARCLCDFDFPVTGDVEGFYIEPGREDEIPEEQETEPISDGKVDLEHALRQALVLELPFAPLHAEDCAGICPTCGADLNEGPCGCEAEAPDSPFAKLKGMFGDEEADGSQGPAR